jgi:aspartokinase-like uncharacterized kinase
MWPGSIVTSANATCVAALKTVESTIFTVPPGNCFAGIVDAAKLYGFGTSPAGSPVRSRPRAAALCPV